VLPAVPQWLWVVAFVLLNTTVNLRGIDTTARANKIFLYAQLLVLALFVVLAGVAISTGVNGAHWTFTPFFNPELFSPSLVFGALSIAVLSFLGFDAISTMAEETRGGSRVVGRATVLALVMVAALFAVQTYLGALMLPGQAAFDGETATNEAFYTVANLIGGTWFKVVVAVAVAVGAAIANALVAQAATSRLLFSMARDRQLPTFLAHVNPTRRVPERAVLLVSAVSLVLALFFVGQRAHVRAAPRRAGVRLRDHRLRAVERGREREDRWRGLAAGRLRGAARAAADRPLHRAQGRLRPVSGIGRYDDQYHSQALISAVGPAAGRGRRARRAGRPSGAGAGTAPGPAARAGRRRRPWRAAVARRPRCPGRRAARARRRTA